MSRHFSKRAFVTGLFAMCITILAARPALAGLVNVALNKSATQSSTYGGSTYPASNAVDGNLGTFNHTVGDTSDQNPWWRVNLGSMYPLGSVTVYNRQDCCQVRFQDITVQLLAADGVTPVFTSALLNPGNILGNPASISLDLAALTGGTVSAQYLRVSRTGNPALGGSHDSYVLAMGEAQAFANMVTTGGTAPGGFIKTGAGTNLLYHLDAAKGITLNGSNVSAWADQGTAARNFLQSDSNKQPALVASALGGNGLPAVRFDGDNSDPDGTGPLLVSAYADELVLNSATSPQTVFIVNSTFQHRGLDGIWGYHNADQGIRRSSGAGWSFPGNDGDFTTAGSMFVNGAATNSAALNTPHILAATGSGSYAASNLGDYFQYGHPAGARSWNGDIGEVIVFDRKLNLAEIHVINNHLSAKYAIPLAANDFYAGDDPANGNYDSDVFGAGRVDGSNKALEAGSAGMGFELSDATLVDGSFLLAGHKTPTNSWVTATDPSGFARQRWDRVWYVDKTGSVDATLAFGFSDGGVSLVSPPAGGEYVLLYSPTNAFSFSILSWGGQLVGLDQVVFNLSNLQIEDGYYTLATALVPEPATLLLMVLGVTPLVPLFRRRGRPAA
jgi:hypothetical protein